MRPGGHVRRVLILAMAVAIIPLVDSARGVETNTRLDGYRGIWFTIGQDNEWGPKYSGGLSTYTANHVPTAVYAPAVNKTFFVYGGVDDGSGDLLIVASCYDHASCEVPRPVVVYHKVGISDPHDNGALLIDREGHLWVFISGRGTVRPGLVYRSARPYSIDTWEYQLADERTYPQPWYLDDGIGQPLFLHMFTKYTAGRELYWATSSDGIHWSPHYKMAGFGGHYQTSCERDGKIATAFNYHPGGDVDKRTNLYYLQTTDRGQTWTTAGGTPVTVPLSQVSNAALLVDYQAQGKLCYINDTNLDDQGNPHIVYITSGNYAAGPAGDPRTWHLARWTGQQWVYSHITVSDHNYDMGSLCIEGDLLRIVGPTENGPQVYGTGGEVAVWLSHDLGGTWTKARDVTTASQYNHSYVRRPRHARDPFYAYWADGDPFAKSESRLYFCNRAGTHVWRLPTLMRGDTARPERATDFSPSATASPLWQSSFETRSAPVLHGQAAVRVANAAGTPGRPTGTQALTYAAYNQSGVGAAPSAGAGAFALSMPNSRTNGISTSIASDAGNLAVSLTFEGYFKTPESAAISFPTYIGRRLVTQKQSVDGTTRLAIGLHANGSKNVLAVFYKTPDGTNMMHFGTTPVLANTWYYFALICESSHLRWFLNSNQEGEVLEADMAPPGAGILAIGNLRLDGSSDRGFYGLLDSIRISDRALDFSELLINGGHCELSCGQQPTAGVLWCSGFEMEPGTAVSHGLPDSGADGTIENTFGPYGTSAGTPKPSYAAYGQTGVGDAPASMAGSFALSWPNGQGVAISTCLRGNAGHLRTNLTFEGLFSSADTQPVTMPSAVGRRLVSQRAGGTTGGSRLAIGLQAVNGHNVLAVYWLGADQTDHTTFGRTPIQPGSWHHFALVYDGGLRWYLDSQEEGALTGVALASASDDPIVIGNDLATGLGERGFVGWIDEVRIVDAALSPNDFILPPTTSGQEPCYPACPLPFADADADADVDQSDFGKLQACFTGDEAGGPWILPECLCFDRDGDGAIGQIDVASFLECITGPDVAWTPQQTPGCLP